MRGIKRTVLFAICVLVGALIVASSVQLRPVPGIADPAPGLEDRVRTWVTGQMIVEHNVRIPMRDGLDLAANIFRPNKPGKFPVIMLFTGFDKDALWGGPFGSSLGSPAYEPYEPTNTMATDLLLGTTFEAEEPASWVPYGYVVIIVDPRGYASSPGTMFPPGFSTIGYVGENAILSQGLWARDQYDAIEWAAKQDWSTGNVGLDGVSILAFSQWRVAALKPPHLKAICPWEGMTDFLRDVWFRGGIPETKFGPRPVPPHPAWPPPANEQPPVPVYMTEDEFLPQITIPALICGSWSSQGVHTRGAFRAWRKISSKEKWLYNHGLAEWAQFYGTDAHAVRKMFFDHFLKGVDYRIMDTPQVRLELRDTVDTRIVGYEDEFPIARTHYKNLYLDAKADTLNFHKVHHVGKITYDSATGEAVFVHTFKEDTEIAGYMSLKLWVSPEEANDMDIFITVRKLDASGNEVSFDRILGWLRLSYRELDPKLSTPWEPYLKTVTGPGQKVTPGEIVPCEIAILPSSFAFHKGETLRLGISGIYLGSNAGFGFADTVNKGEHSIYTGGNYDSHLLIPVILPERGPKWHEGPERHND